MLKAKILDILQQKKGTVVTGGQLSISLGVSRTAVWKSINALRESGHQIVSVPNVGYKLLNDDDTLSKSAIEEKLNTTFVGRELVILSSVSSTNQYLKELDVSGVPNGFVVIANEQLKGKGRKSRTFISEKDEGIYLSILLKLSDYKYDVRLITICAAVAVTRAIEKTCGISAGIKWVNDIFCGGKKICGILTEATLSGELQEIDTVIVGIGINTGNVPGELKDIATSVLMQTGRKGMRNELIAQTLNQFERQYLDYTKMGKQQELIGYYESKLFIKGRQVLAKNGDNEYLATVIGVDGSGALIVESKDGEIMHISTGEIKLIDRE